MTTSSCGRCSFIRTLGIVGVWWRTVGMRYSRMTNCPGSSGTIRTGVCAPYWTSRIPDGSHGHNIDGRYDAACDANADECHGRRQYEGHCQEDASDPSHGSCRGPLVSFGFAHARVLCVPDGWWLIFHGAFEIPIPFVASTPEHADDGGGIVQVDEQCGQFLHGHAVQGFENAVM